MPWELAFLECIFRAGLPKGEYAKVHSEAHFYCFLCTKQASLSFNMMLYGVVKTSMTMLNSANGPESAPPRRALRKQASAIQTKLEGVPMSVIDRPAAATQRGETTLTRPLRLVLKFAPQTMDRLMRLAQLRGKTKAGDIVREALAVYGHILEARQGNDKFRVLLDRGDGKPSELVLPM